MRRRTAVIAAAAALVVIGGGATAWSLTRPADPAGAARSLVAALERGDTDAVFALVEGGRRSAPAAADAFGGAAAYLSDAEVTGITADGDTATARVRATLESRALTLTIPMTRDSGTWRAGSGLFATVEITPLLGTAVTIGGTVVPAGSVMLLPGVYEASGAPAELLEGSDAFAAVPGENAAVSLPTRLSAEGHVRAQEQLDAYAAACTAGGASVPDACGLRIPWPADLAAASGFTYRVERTPALRIAEDGASFVADGGIVVATVAGTTRAGEAASVTYRDDTWTLRGSVRLDAESMTLSVR